MSPKKYLNPKQIEKLQKTLKEQEKADFREKVMILLLLSNGKKQSKNSEFLGWLVNKIFKRVSEGKPRASRNYNR
ncbi:hypothetical protein QUA42_25300 [Microcoleus sp. Pol11C2]|uniref:hypothetical protein n=1 Tax=Microcoleus sp. Pol11C2 TaxID=3055389 RepID=UPI002FD62EE3